MAAPTPRYHLAQVLQTNSKAIACLQFSTAGALLAAGSADGTVTLYPTPPSLTLSEDTKPFDASHQSLYTGHHSDSGINDVAFSSDDRILATAGDDKTLVIWDTETQQPQRVLRGHAHYVYCCTFNPASQMLVSGSYDETVKLWDLRSGKPARTFQAHSDPVSSVDINREGSWIVSGAYDGLCRVWDLVSGQCLKTIYADKTPPVSHVKFTPNGKFLVASYLDSTIRLWDFQRGGNCLKSYTGHISKQFCAFSDFLVSHERKYIVSGSEDGFVYAFDIQSRAVVQKLGDPLMTASATMARHGCVGVACHPTAHIIAANSPINDKQNVINVFIDHETPTVAPEQQNTATPAQPAPQHASPTNQTVTRMEE